MDNSRFKFRVYITVSYEDDDGNEKEVSFYLYNIVISDEGDFIYIDRDSLIDALNNLLSADEIDRIEETLQENSCTGDYENICIESGFYKNPEQCTGLKDKNGKLIYEHDYVMINKIIYKVFWNKTKISLANILNGDIIDFIETEEMEIIGNEHEETNIRKI